MSRIAGGMGHHPASSHQCCPDYSVLVVTDDFINCHGTTLSGHSAYRLAVHCFPTKPAHGHLALNAARCKRVLSNSQCRLLTSLAVTGSQCTFQCCPCRVVNLRLGDPEAALQPLNKLHTLLPDQPEVSMHGSEQHSRHTSWEALSHHVLCCIIQIEAVVLPHCMPHIGLPWYALLST